MTTYPMWINRVHSRITVGNNFYTPRCQLKLSTYYIAQYWQ